MGTGGWLILLSRTMRDTSPEITSPPSPALRQKSEFVQAVVSPPFSLVIRFYTDTFSFMCRESVLAHILIAILYLCTLAVLASH